MLTSKPVGGLILGITFALLAIFAGAGAVEAKLGQDFQTYRTATLKAWKPAGESKSGTDTNYRYQMPEDVKQQQISPGYAVGLTITVSGGKISGQSLAIRVGANPIGGGLLSALQGFAFAYESLGKPVPTRKDQLDFQFKAFSGAVTQAFLGQAQILRYPGYPGKITLSKDSIGNLIIAVTPENPLPAAQKPAAPTTH